MTCFPNWGFHRTRMGWRSPLLLMLSASRSIDPGSNSLRGWSGSGTMFVSSISPAARFLVKPSLGDAAGKPACFWLGGNARSAPVRIPMDSARFPPISLMRASDFPMSGSLLGLAQRFRVLGPVEAWDVAVPGVVELGGLLPEARPPSE